MQLPIYVVDAFTDKLFGGNQAAVCPLQDWLPDELMQQLAAENNLSETAFFVQKGPDDYHIRWFTPEFEIDLCGHATLATAYIIFNELKLSEDHIVFNCKSGRLDVKKRGDLIELNFPSRMPVVSDAPDGLLKGVNIQPQQVLKARDYFLVYASEEEVLQIVPDFNYWNQLNVVGVIVTAKGKEVDFVSRFFVPNSVIGEDPVTGSAHSSLIPYWSKELGKEVLTAHQISKRGGVLYCEDKGDRVIMAGNGVLYSKGEFYIR